MNIPLPVLCVLLGIFLANSIALNVWKVQQISKIKADIVAIKTALAVAFNVEIKNAS